MNGIFAPLGLPAPEIFTLPNDRGTLCYAIFGDPTSSRTVFYHHGLPGSHLEAAGFHTLGQQRGLRIIGIDRPGMGKSSFQQPTTPSSAPTTSSPNTPPPWRRIIDWPTDLLALADHLQVDKFGIIGISGGGPYTYACISQIPCSRLLGCCILASAYPAHFGYSGIKIENWILFKIAPWSTWLTEKILYLAMGRVAADTDHPERMQRLLEDSFSRKEGDVDRLAWVTGGKSRTIIDPGVFRAVMAESVAWGLAGGCCKGAAWDCHAITTDWGFRLEELGDVVQGLDGQEEGKKKVVVWHGEKDVNCPAQMARKAQTLMPGAEWRFSEEDAHLSVTVNHLEEVVEAMDRILG